MRIEKIVLGIALLLMFQACSKDEVNEQATFEDLDFFYQNATSLKVEVAYEPNAVPYISGGFGTSANFDFTANNLNALFSQRTGNINVEIDKTLNEMTLIPAQNKSSFTMADIRAISDQYQSVQSSQNQGVIFVVYLDGYFDLNGQAQTNVLGVYAGSFALAIFKPVIAAIPGGGVLGSDPKFQVEQGTLLHEIAHGLGLVNAGVSMQSAHQDEAHGKHCMNTNCVMYWANEGASGASGLFGSAASVNQMVFGQECINDITNYLN